MAVITTQIVVETKGFTDIHNITDAVAYKVAESGLREGSATIFAPGSTAGITTIEFESGVVADLKEAIERLAPETIGYAHDERWGDGNGFSHVRAALLGASFAVPFVGKKLLLGTWQQIVLIDFDNRARQRKIVVQLQGE